jgi:hypothetical protein
MSLSSTVTGAGQVFAVHGAKANRALKRRLRAAAAATPARAKEQKSWMAFWNLSTLVVYFFYFFRDPKS